jgi:hypothetical protein
LTAKGSSKTAVFGVAARRKQTQVAFQNKKWNPILRKTFADSGRTLTSYIRTLADAIGTKFIRGKRWRTCDREKFVCALLKKV